MIAARIWGATGLACLIAIAAALPGDARAQQVYKIVGPDGRVTFSDKPPQEQNAKASLAPVAAPRGAATGLAALPFELRQAASRYPVTLYTTPGCQPCQSGRAMLGGRGIPFSERTVTSSDDIEAFRRLGGAQTLPLLTVGAQQLKGFSEPEWSQYLDAAGYPKTSQLPRGYLPPPAAPLVAAQAQPQRAPEQPPAPAAQAPEPQQPPADNPAGIKF